MLFGIARKISQEALKRAARHLPLSEGSIVAEGATGTQ
jgi:hypothetical protein